MKSYGQYCPISKSAEILGERWMLLVLRELFIGASQFNEIARGLPGISRSLLTKRLRELERADLVERLDGKYLPTEAAMELRPLVFGLGAWAAKWILVDPDPAELDADLLMWWCHDRLDTSGLPERRVVLEFRFTDDPQRFWLVLEPVGNSVCLHDPGFPVDAVVTSDLVTLHLLWHDKADMQAALRDGRLRFEGTPAITRRLPQVLTVMSVADLAAATAAQ